MSFRYAPNADVLIAEMRLQEAIGNLNKCRDLLKAGGALDETMEELFNEAFARIKAIDVYITDEIMTKPETKQ